MSLYVNTSELKGVANEIATKRQAISDLYQGEIKSILTESETALVSSGLNFNELGALYDAIFNNLDAKLFNMHNVLSKKIATSYDDLGENLAKAFNKEFAEEMSKLIF